MVDFLYPKYTLIPNGALHHPQYHLDLYWCFTPFQVKYLATKGSVSQRLAHTTNAFAYYMLPPCTQGHCFG